MAVPGLVARVGARGGGASRSGAPAPGPGKTTGAVALAGAGGRMWCGTGTCSGGVGGSWRCTILTQPHHGRRHGCTRLQPHAGCGASSSWDTSPESHASHSKLGSNTGRLATFPSRRASDLGGESNRRRTTSARSTAPKSSATSAGGPPTHPPSSSSSTPGAAETAGTAEWRSGCGCGERVCHVWWHVHRHLSV